MRSHSYQNNNDQSGTSMLKKRESYANTIRKEQRRQIIKRKRKEAGIYDSTECSSLESIQGNPSNLSEENIERRPQSEMFSNHSEANNPISFSPNTNRMCQNDGPSLLRPFEKKESNDSEMKNESGSNQPPIQVNKQILNQSQNFSQKQKISNILSNPKAQNTFLMMNQGQKGNEFSFNNTHEMTFNQIHNTPQFGTPISSNQSRILNSSFLNSPIASQSFQVIPQNNQNDFTVMGMQGSGLNDSFVNHIYCPNTLGMNFVNILSNKKIFENPCYQNEYIKSVEIFKQNIGLNCFSPQPEQPNYFQQSYGMISSPPQYDSYQNQALLTKNCYPPQYHLKNFEQIKQNCKKESPKKIKSKQFEKQLPKDQENPLKGFLKRKKYSDLKLQEIKEQFNTPKVNNFSKYKNWGKVIKQYSKYLVFDKVLGKGSYGAVYLGVNTKNDQKLAVKKISVKKSKHLIEVNCLKQINHQNIVALYDSLLEEKEKECYLFMEFCEENLREKLDNLNNSNISRFEEIKMKISFIEQLINGMNELNEKGFIHRDLKFENILIKNGSILKICDFGLCRKVNKKLQVDSVRCGTPYTMAPEIFFHPKNVDQNPTYTEKADIFSLAVIIHEIIYGIHPFDYEQDKLKNLELYQRRRTKQMARKIKEKYKLNISWIDEIIERGLKKLQKRISWVKLMQIYKYRNKQNEIKPKQTQQNIYEHEKDLLKNKDPQVPKDFKKKSNFVFAEGQPINIKKLVYPKLEKNKKQCNPQEKQCHLNEKPQQILGGSSRKQQKEQEHSKKEIQSDQKPKCNSKINESRKIDLNFQSSIKCNELKNSKEESKKDEVKNVIEVPMQIQKEIKTIVQPKIQCIVNNDQNVQKIQSNEKFDFKKLKLLLLLAIVNLLIVMGVLIFSQDKAPKQALKNVIN